MIHLRTQGPLVLINELQTTRLFPGKDLVSIFIFPSALRTFLFSLNSDPKFVLYCLLVNITVGDKLSGITVVQ